MLPNTEKEREEEEQRENINEAREYTHVNTFMASQNPKDANLLTAGYLYSTILAI